MPKDALGHGSNSRGGAEAAAQKKQQYQMNAGNRAAFALRNKMIHDEGKDARIRSAALGAAHQGLVHTLIPGIGKAFLGMTAGLASAILKSAARQRGGHGRR